MNLNGRMNLSRHLEKFLSGHRGQGWRRPWAPAAFGRIWRGVLVTGAAIWFWHDPASGIASTPGVLHLAPPKE